MPSGDGEEAIGGDDSTCMGKGGGGVREWSDSRRVVIGGLRRFIVVGKIIT